MRCLKYSIWCISVLHLCPPAMFFRNSFFFFFFFAVILFSVLHQSLGHYAFHSFAEKDVKGLIIFCVLFNLGHNSVSYEWRIVIVLHLKKGVHRLYMFCSVHAAVVTPYWTGGGSHLSDRIWFSFCLS